MTLARTPLATLAVLFVVVSTALGNGLPTVKLTASRTAVLNDGRDATELIAEIRDSNGRLVPDGTQITFHTNLGTFAENPTVQTRAGSARIRLTSPQKGTALITAQTSGAYAGGVQKIEIVFTDDPSQTFQGNNYIVIDSNDSLLYAAVERVIEATGKKSQDTEHGMPGARVAFRNIEIFADRLQLDCSSNTVKAVGNIIVRRAGKRLTCARLNYNLISGEGFAVAELENRIRPVKVSGADLKMEPLEMPVAPKFFELVDVTASGLLITARHIVLFPNEKLQFKRPTIYQDGQKLVSMPFYSVGLYSSQLFSDQILKVGSQGLGVDLPVYYDLSPVSTGIMSIRHGERYGRSVFSNRPGWSMDLTQSYNSLGSGSRYTGELGLTGFNRSDWGLRWMHSHELSSGTRGNFFIDFPEHRSVFGSTNLNKQMGSFYVGMNLSGNRSLRGFSSSGSSADLYVETVPKKLGKSGYMMAVGGNTGAMRFQSGDFKTSTFHRGVQTRLFSKPFNLDGKTTLTHNVSVGQIWANQGMSGESVMTSLSATRQIGGANLQLGYDYTKQPTFVTEGRHRVSGNLLASGGSKWNFFFYGSTMLDAPSSSLIGDFSYAFLPRYRLTLSTTVQRFAVGTFTDHEIGIGRVIGGREFILSYSTYNHRFYFNLEAGRF